MQHAASPSHGRDEVALQQVHKLLVICARPLCGLDELGHAVGVDSKVDEFPGDVTGQGDERVAFACLSSRACCLELA